MSLLKQWTNREILALSFVRGSNSTKQLQIIEQFKSFEDFFNSNQINKFLKPTNDELFVPSFNVFDSVDKQLELCEKNKVNIVSFWDNDYPKLLKEISYPPVLLFVKGKLQAADKYGIAIVGTRHRSIYGKMVTEKFAEVFVKNGLIVISGLAYGIDTDAHLATVKSNGVTYSVIASGIDLLSPSISVKNAERIVESGGAIISEYRCGVAANLGSFPQRNRIISGIAKATVIIESGIKGGSLITARMALNENREVFAVPGNISSKTSQGTNKLIKETAAIPALSAESILEDLGIGQSLFTKNQIENKPVFSNPTEKKIYNLINDVPMHIDFISSVAELEISETMVRLLELEFRSLIRQLPGKYYVRSL